jgi:hypothetical protein
MRNNHRLFPCVATNHRGKGHESTFGNCAGKTTILGICNTLPHLSQVWTVSTVVADMTITACMMVIVSQPDAFRMTEASSPISSALSRKGKLMLRRNA